MKICLCLVSCVFFVFFSLGAASGSGLGDVVKGLTDALDAGEKKAESPGEKSGTAAAPENTAEKAASGESDKKSLGIKEALRVGIETAVKQVGTENGFYKNDAIKIALPEKLQKADEFVRQLGGQELSDALVLKMNRAAEQAAPQALDIFIDAIKGMQIEDAARLLSGQENAATDYLEKNTSDSLAKAFYPIVKSTMEELGAVKLYNEYAGKFASNPLLKMANMDTDISQYVTDKSLDGLFTVVAEEEKNIRQNPAARTSDLLQDVFGSLGM